MSNRVAAKVSRTVFNTWKGERDGIAVSKPYLDVFFDLEGGDENRFRFWFDKDMSKKKKAFYEKTLGVVGLDVRADDFEAKLNDPEALTGNDVSLVLEDDFDENGNVRKVVKFINDPRREPDPLSEEEASSLLAEIKNLF